MLFFSFFNCKKYIRDNSFIVHILQPLSGRIASYYVKNMPSLHLARVAARFDGYRNALDKNRRDTFDYILYELAGRREETLISHPNHTEAAMMNILIELELRLRHLEQNHKEH